jgi:hypothetical protein
MTRVSTANYLIDTDTTFFYATDDLDAFDRNDVSFVARALERHDHSAGRGIPVTRLGSGIVTTANIAEGAITTSKIATNSIDSTKLGADSVTATAIGSGQVGASEIADGAVGTAEMADGSITLPKLNAHATANRVYMTDGAGSAAVLGQITAAHLQGGLLSSTGFFVDNTISGTRLIDGTVSGTKIGNNTITNGNLADSTILPVKLANGTADRVLGTNGSGGMNLQQVVPNMLQGGLINSSSFMAAGVVNSTVLGGSAVTPAHVAFTSGSAAAGKYVESDGAGGFRWSTPSGTFSFPSGYGGWVRQASEIPAGHTRETAIDGRLPVGAGTTGGQTFVEANSYGSAWAHTHDSNTWSGSASATMGGSTGTEQGGTLYDEDETGGGHNARDHGPGSQACCQENPRRVDSVSGQYGANVHASRSSDAHDYEHPNDVRTNAPDDDSRTHGYRASGRHARCAGCTHGAGEWRKLSL